MQKVINVLFAQLQLMCYQQSFKLHKDEWNDVSLPIRLESI